MCTPQRAQQCLTAGLTPVLPAAGDDAAPSEGSLNATCVPISPLTQPHHTTGKAPDYRAWPKPCCEVNSPEVGLLCNCTQLQGWGKVKASLKQCTTGCTPGQRKGLGGADRSPTQHSSPSACPPAKGHSPPPAQGDSKPQQRAARGCSLRNGQGQHQVTRGRDWV